MKALHQRSAAASSRSPLNTTVFADALFRTEVAFVMIDGAMLHAQYLREPDAQTRADDVVLEAGPTQTADDSEVMLTCAEVADAEDLGNGKLRLRNGSLLQFLSTSTIH